MARRLLQLWGWAVTIAVALPMSACLIPQDDRLLEYPPSARNRPVRILENLVVPARLVDLPNGPNCSQTFSVRVEDPDVNDPIIVRWFLDNAEYGPDKILTNNGKPVRDEAATLTLTPSSAGSPVANPGTYLLEVLVADWTLNNRDPLPHPTLPDAGTNPSYVVSWAWFITVTSSSLSCTP